MGQGNGRGIDEDVSPCGIGNDSNSRVSWKRDGGTDEGKNSSGHIISDCERGRLKNKWREYVFQFNVSELVIR